MVSKQKRADGGCEEGVGEVWRQAAQWVGRHGEVGGGGVVVLRRNDVHGQERLKGAAVLGERACGQGQGDISARHVYARVHACVVS
jgi:hypothetical protein